MSFFGTQELLVILVVALVVVGPKRLPDLAKNLGKGIRNFKNATAKMRSELNESGAMDEINKLKADMKGMADEINPMKPASYQPQAEQPDATAAAAVAMTESPSAAGSEPEVEKTFATANNNTDAEHKTQQDPLDELMGISKDA